MLNLFFTNEPDEIYQVNFSEISEHIVQIECENIPKNTSGFILSREGHHDNWDYSEYTTIYSMPSNNIIQYSNDGSVAPPVINNVVVKVIWNDLDDVMSKRPKSVTVTSYVNDRRKNILTLKPSNDWTKVYENVKDTDVYTVTADDVEGYSMYIEGTTVIYTLQKEAEND